MLRSISGTSYNKAGSWGEEIIIEEGELIIILSTFILPINVEMYRYYSKSGIQTLSLDIFKTAKRLMEINE